MKKFMVIIRKATINDAEAIRNISLSRCISTKSEERSGLIDYLPPSIEKYSKRISLGQFYVAEDNEKNLVGFIDSFSSEVLNEIFKDNPIISHILKLENKPFSYSNTIVLSKNQEGRGISSKLFRTLINNLDKNYFSLWGTIIHRPKKNETSVKFAERLGFEFQQEFTISSGLTFGLYKKPLKINQTNLPKDFQNQN